MHAENEIKGKLNLRVLRATKSHREEIQFWFSFSRCKVRFARIPGNAANQPAHDLAARVADLGSR